jgi:hypothetical protein
MSDWNQLLNSTSRITPWEGPVNPPTLEDTLLIRSSYSWVSEGPFSNLVKLTPDLAGFLIDPRRSLPVEEPLLGLLDQGFEYTEIFRVLWEFRFWAREEPNMVPQLAMAFRGWLRGFQLPPEFQKILQQVGVGRSPEGSLKKLDHLFFLHLLAQQQGTLRHSIFAVIGLNKILEFGPDVQRIRFSDLYDLYLLVNRWGRFGGSIRLIYEFSRTPEFLWSLHRDCPRLEAPLRCNL